MVRTTHRLHIAQTHSPIEGASPRSRVSVMHSRMQTVDPNVFCIPSVPARHRPAAYFLNLGRFDGVRDL